MLSELPTGSFGRASCTCEQPWPRLGKRGVGVRLFVRICSFLLPARLEHSSISLCENSLLAV